jgi:hypothetical protein
MAAANPATPEPTIAILFFVTKSKQISRKVAFQKFFFLDNFFNSLTINALQNFSSKTGFFFATI